MKILVTGISGFLAGHIALQLLARGYEVRGTLRSLDKAAGIKDLLTQSSAEGFEGLEFACADLNEDAGWAEAAKGCDYVLHVASPFPGANPSNEMDLIAPAREGTLRVLRAARDAGARRVVVTSSFGAIGYGHERHHPTFTEDDWTQVDASGVSAYIKSKTLAERAAWEFAAREGGSLEVTVVNPVGIFGPALGRDLSSSLVIVKRLLSGEMSLCPNLWFGVVDVRDAADLHIRAMLSPAAAGERFIGVAGEPVSMFQVGQMLKRHFGDRARRVPRFETPGWLIRLLALWSPGARAVSKDIGVVRRSSNDKARRILGWTPRSTEAALVATARSLFDLGVIVEH